MMSANMAPWIGAAPWRGDEEQKLPKTSLELAMRMMFKALVLAAGLSFCQAGIAHADLKIGFAAEPFPPFSSKDASGKWVGWEVEAIDAV